MTNLIALHNFKDAEISPPEEFLDTWAWTASKLQLWRTCRRKFFWAYVLKIAPKKKAPPLLYGEIFHKCLEQWYLGKKMNTILATEKRGKEKEFLAKGEFRSQEDVDNFIVLLDTFDGMLAGYALHYAHDREKYTISSSNVEKSFELPLKPGLRFRGKIDLVTGKPAKNNIIVWDHKTASSLTENYFARLPLDTQTRGYVFAQYQLGGVWPQKIHYNTIKKCQLRRRSGETLETFTARIAADYKTNPAKYFRREVLDYRKEDIAAFLFELGQVHKDFMAVASSRDWRNPRAWGINDAACVQYYALCPYHDICVRGFQQEHSVLFTQSKPQSTEPDEATNEEI